MVTNYSIVGTPNADGSGLLDIVGSNFGPSDASIKVLVQNNVCQLNYTSQNEIRCITPPGVGRNQSLVVIVGGQVWPPLSVEASIRFQQTN